MDALFMLIIYANSLNPYSSGIVEYTFKALDHVLFKPQLLYDMQTQLVPNTTPLACSNIHGSLGHFTPHPLILNSLHYEISSLLGSEAVSLEKQFAWF
jgi:hypothetical protein